MILSLIRKSGKGEILRFIVDNKLNKESHIIKNYIHRTGIFSEVEESVVDIGYYWHIDSNIETIIMNLHNDNLLTLKLALASEPNTESIKELINKIKREEKISYILD